MTHIPYGERHEMGLMNTLSIQLGNGLEARIDTIDSDLVHYHWYPTTQTPQRATCSINRKSVYLGRVVFSRVLGRALTTGEEVRYIDGNRLNNTRVNLCLTSRSERVTHDNRIRARTESKSGYPGVTWDDENRKWLARINVGGRKKHIGRFQHLDDAIDARKNAERRYLNETSGIVAKDYKVLVS